MSAWQGDGADFPGRVIAVVAVVAVLALVVGFAVGTYLGRESAPDLARLAGQAHASATAIDSRLAPAEAGYAAAIADGRVADPDQYADAQARIAAAKSALTQQRALFEALAPGAYARALAAVTALFAASSEPVEVAEFERRFADAEAAIAVLAGR
jgi:hypothetical protein